MWGNNISFTQPIIDVCVVIILCLVDGCRSAGVIWRSGASVSNNENTEKRKKIADQSGAESGVVWVPDQTAAKCYPFGTHPSSTRTQLRVGARQSFAASIQKKGGLHLRGE
jgi:hypothetical protein